jgi:hypothetical protein
MFLDFNAARPAPRPGSQELITFATNEDGKTPRTLPPDTATTLALGEEGGEKPPKYITMAIPEEGTRPILPPPDQATTLALGEEGGIRPNPRPNPRPIPFPPEPNPPQITTLALGEEGGNIPPAPSTKALGEEGGGIPPLPPPNGNSVSTQVAQQVLREADGMGSREPQPYWASNGIDSLIRRPIPPNNQKDGQLTRQELSAYVDQLRNTRFIQAPGPEFDNKLKTAEFMLQNFDELASASGSPRPPIYYETQGKPEQGITQEDALFRRPYPFPGNNQTIDANDLNVASRRDGRPENISQRDVNQQVATYAFWETGYPPIPEPLPGGGGVSKVWLEGGINF